MKGANAVESLLERVLGEVDGTVVGDFKGVVSVKDLDCFCVSDNRFSCDKLQCIGWVKEERDALHPTTRLQQR